VLNRLSAAIGEVADTFPRGPCAPIVTSDHGGPGLEWSKAQTLASDRPGFDLVLQWYVVELMVCC
jgi:hypothetical protein